MPQQHVRKIDEQHQRLTEKERQERNQQLQRTMWLLVHASACSDHACPSNNCAKVKALFNHAMTCRVKIGGGCQYCRRMWALLQAHAKMCTASDCPVPRCRWAACCRPAGPVLRCTTLCCAYECCRLLWVCGA